MSAVVYALVDPITQHPLYIGSTRRDPKKREKEHLRHFKFNHVFVELFQVPETIQYELEYLLAYVFSKDCDLKQSVRELDTKRTAKKINYLLNTNVPERLIECLENARSRKLTLSAIAWCKENLSKTEPKEVHSTLIRRVFGQTQHRISKVLRDMLLVKHGGYWPGAHCYSYTLNSAF